jgi:N-acetylglutamate synthase-like GNAT family acetyltransferase
MILHILRPVAEDFSELTELCFTAKKHWGYPDYLLEMWKDELTITPRYIRNNRIAKIQNENGKIVAFGHIKQDGQDGIFEIRHLWILPEFVGTSIPKLLLAHLEGNVGEKSTIKVVPDPNMKGFFQQNGYHKVAETLSKPDGLKLPVLKKVIRRSES